MMKSLLLRLGVISALATLGLAPMCKADTRDKKTKISLTAPIEVPGSVLTPGTYVFKLLESSSNRHIVQILNEDENRTYSLSFTAAARRVVPTDKTVLTFYEGRGDSPRAVRTWFYPGDVDGQEFIYGKDQARLIAVSNPAPVEPLPPSIQLESTPKTEPLPAPVPQSASVILAPVESKPPVQAEQTEPPAQPAAEEPTLLAQAQEPTKTEPAPAPAAPDSSNQLPQTASDLPLIALSGFSAIALALGLRRWDRRPLTR